MTDIREYTIILDDVMQKWLGEFKTLEPLDYRMLAILLDDPMSVKEEGIRFVVDINKPEIQRKLDMLNGPYFNTIMKMLELRMYNEDSKRNSKGIENSCRTLV